MTSPSSPATGGSLGQALSSPRTLAAWGSLGYAGLLLIFAFFDWILPGDGTFTSRSAGASFVTLETIALPVLAVLLAVYVEPMLAEARLIAAIALLEYAIAFVFGLVTLLIGLGAAFDGVSDANDVFDALRYVVLGFAQLGLVGVAALVVWRAFTTLGGRLPTGRA